MKNLACRDLKVATFLTVACMSYLTVATPTWAAPATSGLDTGPNQATMPFSIEGSPIMTLSTTGLLVSQGDVMVSSGNLGVQGNLAVMTGVLTLPGQGAKIGIGTNNPTSALEVALGNLNVAAGNLTLASSTGRVGIGTTMPQSSLDVASGFIHLGAAAADGGPCPLSGLIASDSSGHLLSCVGNQWTPVNKPRLVQSEQITCELGAGANGPCSSHGNGNTESLYRTTTTTHDLCILSQVAGWAGGLYGQCLIDGAPGATWRLQTSNYASNQTVCRMTCYDFQ